MSTLREMAEWVLTGHIGGGGFMDKRLLMLVWLAGCAGSPETPDPLVEPSCVANLTGQSPIDGATDVATATVIEIQFSAPPDPGWSVEIQGASGLATLAPNGLTAIFVPETALEWDTTYTVVVEVCEVQTLSSFTTTTEPVTVQPGDAFELPFADLQWNAPSSAAVFTTFVEFESFLMEVVSVAPNGASFEAAFTAAWLGGEPECPSAVEIVADFSTNPIFTTSAGVMEIPVDGAIVPLTIYIDDLTLEGRFTAAGDLVDVQFVGRIDTRPFDGLLGGDGATCDLAVLAGDTCIPCADGVAACLDLDVESAVTVPSQGPGIVNTCLL